MKPRTITSTLIAIVVVLQLISLGAVTQGTQTRLYEQAKLLAVHELDVRAKGLVIQAQQFLDPIKSQLSISRQLVADGLLSTESSKTLERYFLSQLRSNLSMDSMYLGRYDGSFVAVSRFDHALSSDYSKPVFRTKISVVMPNNARTVVWREYSLTGETLNSWEDENDVYDPHQREWYTKAQANNHPVWTNAFSIADSDKINIAASVNLRNKAGLDAGVLGVSVNLSELSELVSAIPTSTRVSAIILDNELNQIAASTSLGTQADVVLQALNSASNEREGIAGDRQHGKIVRSGNTAEYRLDPVDKHWFSEDTSQAYLQRRIQLFDGALHWRVLLQSPIIKLDNDHKSVMLDGVYRAMGIILFPGAVALLMIVGLGSPIQRLYRRATIDYLTKAFNREEFVNRFSKRLAKLDQSKPLKAQWVAIALDLDGFKQINDQHGHDAGDNILKSVVSRLQKCVDRPGFVGRLGGDEFAVAIKLQPGADARATVERIRRMVVQKAINTGQASHVIGMTAGVALVRRGESVIEVLDRADRALVSGKAIAKNTTYCFSDSLPELKLVPGRAYQKIDHEGVAHYREVSI